MLSLDIFSGAAIGLAALQALLLLALAPLMTGISRQIRARMQSRRGPGIWQDYRDIFKLLGRQDVAPVNSGFVFRAMPYVLISSMLLVAMTLPILMQASPMSGAGDLITLVYLFALFRFFFALSGVDSGSPFAGLGASRELVLGVLVEPILVLSLVVMALIAGSTNIGMISVLASTSWGSATPTAAVLALLACAFAVFLEMGKIPFDYPEAEQELQEGPLTEYSGAGFALVKVGLGLKQVVFASLFIGVFIPFGNMPATEISVLGFLLALVVYLLKLVLIFVLASLVENSLARGRFLLTSQVTWLGFGVAALAFVFYLTGL